MLRLALPRGSAGRAASLIFSSPNSSKFSSLSPLSRLSTPSVRFSSTETQLKSNTLNTESTFNLKTNNDNTTKTIQDSKSEQIETTDVTKETNTTTTTNINNTEEGKVGDNKINKIEGEDQDQQALRMRKYYSHQMIIAARTQDFSSVFKYCTEMKQLGIKPDIIIMETVIDSLANVRMLELAFIVFEQLIQMGLRPTRGTYDSLMKVCDILGENRAAQVLVLKMRDLGVWPELATHNYLISIFTKTHYFERAWAEYSAVKALYGGIHPDLLHNYFLLVTQTRNPKWTLKLLKEVKDTDPSPTQVGSPVSLSMEVFLETKYLDGCKFVFEIEGHSLDEGTLVQILHLAGRTKDDETVSSVFNRIRVITQDTPSRTAFFALLNTCIYSRDALKFLDVVNSMVACGYKLGAVFTEVFTRICETPEQIDAAREHLENLNKKTDSNARVSVDAISAVMRACAKAGEVQRATDLFSACLSDFKLMPDAESFNSVIKACEQSGNVEGAVTLVQQMSSNGVNPSAETYRILIDVCIAAQDLQRAISVLSDMVNNNLPPTYQLYAKLATMCADIRDYQQAQAILDAMVANGLVPDELLVRIATKRERPNPASETQTTPTSASA